MSKNNVELYFNEKISDQEKLIELKGPSFTKPDFVKPNIDSIKIDNKDKNADIKKLDFDINQPLDKIPVEQMKTTNVGITYLKRVYDGLMKSIKQYNTNLSSQITDGIVNPLSVTMSNIGENTSKINSRLQDLRTEFDEFRDAQPSTAEAPILPHATGEENGLL
ncbi:hypothetical protein [Wolbachia endosymbiont (group A) of Myopa testacea]|uniref:hypothetical protein n=1 Tax=Wolbachia endosymbiont (group A) of Myopa testacea TaxID=3066148 RepID=UPI003132CD2D